MNRQRLTQILSEMSEIPERLYQVRRDENLARMVRDEAKENLELAMTNALISGNGQTDGKNAEERKLKSDAYLRKHPEVIGVRKQLQQAEANLLNAQLDTRRVEDQFAAQRAETRAIGSYLEYLAGEPRQNRK